MKESGVHPLEDTYRRLFDAYGPQDWWPGDSPFEIIVGAILTQATSWANVAKAIDNLKDADILSPEGLRDISVEDLAQLIRPSGYFNVKARRLKAFINHLWDAHDGNLGEDAGHRRPCTSPRPAIHKRNRPGDCGRHSSLCRG